MNSYVHNVSQWLRPGAPRLGSHPRGLSQITAAQVQQANREVDALATRLSRQFQIISQARERGFSADVVRDASAEYERLFTQLGALTAQIPSLAGAAFDEWITRVGAFENQISLFEQTTQERIGAAAPARTQKIVFATLGALGVAGLIALGVWYYSRPGYVLAKRGWKTRKRRARRRRR